ncbi:MFS transporter [Xenorhabdus szentirmaii]|uniref:MFS transporter n=1 Tax=Xenorhabdus szentirmaii TaxID=290112 RepID=UPI0019BFB313|nr:MFS transporter [Xenorhabdus sp. 38]MBD2779451.1 MFS transporter [Xenorhabdus sp. 38]
MSRSINNKIDIFIVSAAFFLEVLDATIFTPVLIDISHDLNVPIGIATISIASYIFSLAIFTPLSVNFFSRTSAKKKFILGMMIFFIASFLCSISDNIYHLSISRILQGFGSALVVPIGRTLVLGKTKRENIPIVMTYLIFPALFAPVVAPIIGGYITQNYSWRFIFYLILILSLFILMISIKWLSNERVIFKDSDKVDLLSYSIWFGLVFSIFSFFALATNDYITLALLSVCAAFLFLHLIIKCKNKILDSNLLSNHFFKMNIVYGGFFRVAIYCFPVFLVLSLISIFNYTPLMSGICIVFIFIGNILAKPIAARILSKTKNVKFYFVVSSFMTFFSVLCFLNGEIYNDAIFVYFLCFMHGIARSFQFLGYSSVAFYEIKKEDLYKANTLNNSVMQLNAMLGQSIPALLSTVINFNENGLMYLYVYISIVCILLLIPFINSFFIKSEVV